MLCVTVYMDFNRLTIAMTVNGLYCHIWYKTDNFSDTRRTLSLVRGILPFSGEIG